MKNYSQKGFITLPLMLISLAALGAGTVAAAHNSLPGSPLYGIKTATEKARVALALENDKTTVYMNIAEEKVREIEQLETSAAPESSVSKATAALERNQERALLKTKDLTTEGKNTVDITAKLNENLAKQQATLETVLNKASEAAKPGLERAISHSKQTIEAVRDLKQVKPTSQGKGRE
jgi:serine phosphatase RsbU (regulator of sigma subunit)